MIVVVTGSRQLSDPHRVWDVLDQLLAQHGVVDVRVGDCPTGADLYARQWCLGSGADYRVFHADWRTFGNGAGPMRNSAMIAATPRADLVLAFYEPGAKNRGTRDCATKARAAGIEVRSYGEETQTTTDPEQETLPL